MNITHYKITETSTKPLATDSGWVAVTTPSPSVLESGSFTMSSSENTKHIHAWVKDEAGNVSEVNAASHFDVMLDKTAPTITLSAPTNWTKVDVTITAVINDGQSGVAAKKWAPGKQQANFFATGGSTILPSQNTFAVSADDWYTVYAKDNAGNEAVAYINISNIDTISPTSSAIAAINCNGSIEAFWIELDGIRHIRKTGTDSWSVNNLGGGVIRIAVARNDDGTLEIFAIGTDKNFYTNRQSGLYSDLWKGWVKRGSMGMNDISVARNSDGRLEVFGIDSKETYFWGHELYHQWQSEINNDDSWSGWEKLASNNLRRVASAVNKDGRLEAFFITNITYHVWQRNSHAGPWSKRSLLCDSPPINEISAICNADGRLEVFGISPSNVLYNMWQTKPSSAPWHGWNDKICGKGRVKKISVACNSDGRLEVFGIGMNDFLYNKYQTKASSGPWSDWNLLSDKVKVKYISVARNSHGRLEVFAIGFDNKIYHMCQTAPNSGSWSPWEALTAIGRPADLVSSTYHPADEIVTASGKKPVIRKPAKIKAVKKKSGVKKTVTNAKPAVKGKISAKAKKTKAVIKAKPAIKKALLTKAVKKNGAKKSAKKSDVKGSNKKK